MSVFPRDDDWHELHKYQASYEHTFQQTLKDLGYRAVDGCEGFFVGRGVVNGSPAISLICFHVDDYVHAWSHKGLDDRLVAKFRE